MKNLYGVVVISLYCATANAALNELSGAWAGSIGGLVSPFALMNPKG